MANCRSCGAEITWALWASSRRPVPLNPIADPEGNVVVVGVGAGGAAVIALVASSLVTPSMMQGARFKVHFATCKDAREWRREERKKAKASP